MDAGTSRRAMARPAGPVTFGRLAKRPSSIPAAVAVRFTLSKSLPTRRQRYFGVRSSRTASRASCADCSAPACGRPSPSYAGTGSASTTPRGLPRRRSAPPTLRAPSHLAQDGGSRGPSGPSAARRRSRAPRCSWTGALSAIAVITIRAIDVADHAKPLGANDVARHLRTMSRTQRSQPPPRLHFSRGEVFSTRAHRQSCRIFAAQRVGGTYGSASICVD